MNVNEEPDDWDLIDQAVNAITDEEIEARLRRLLARAGYRDPLGPPVKAVTGKENGVMDLTEAIITRRRRVPLPPRMDGDGDAVTCQLDAVLACAGFKLSRALLTDLSSRETGQVLDIGVALLPVVRRIAGDHIEHNPYFKAFPFAVPATLEFWAQMMQQALIAAAPVDTVIVHTAEGLPVLAVNLLALPGYGAVQHTYEDMLAAHEALATAAGDRITLLHPGDSLAVETHALYLDLAGSPVPLAAEDLALLTALAGECLDGLQPDRVPVRENRAVINMARLGAGYPLLADTVTDVLRLAAALCGGDVTLQHPAWLTVFPRPTRRKLMEALDGITAGNPGKLGDVSQHAEQWKRLAERLHPHEYPGCPHAQRVFAVARGDEHAPSFASKAEAAFQAAQPAEAARLLAVAPGRLFRSLDRILRNSDPGDVGRVLQLAAMAAPDVSGRVLLSVREHFTNRVPKAGLPRIFANRAGRAWVAPDTRCGLDPGVRELLLAMLDAEVTSRLPSMARIIVDPAVLGVALPLTGKPAAPGIGVMPRGSVSDVVPGDQDVLSFFVYWRQQAQRTDYDLSAHLTSADFTSTDFVSWQGYHSADGAVTYSGDITSAPDGATEFISCDLTRMSMPVVIPQVNIYAGEPFDEAAEAFFGYMLRGTAQRGTPFEPATVRMKSDLRGAGRVAMPLAFIRGDDGRWRAKWLHFYLKGQPSMNVVQANRLTTTLLARTVIDRDYLQVRYLARLWATRTVDGIYVQAATTEDALLAAKGAHGPVAYIGMERPDGLPAEVQAYTLPGLAALVPA